MGGLIVATFDWVPETPRGYVTYECVGHWRRQACPIVSKAFHLAIGMPSISRISLLAKCRG